MNRYQLLKKNEEINFQYIRNGILSFQVLRDINIYERYQELEDINSNQMKYLILSDEFELGAKRVEQIVSQMQRRVS